MTDNIVMENNMEHFVCKHEAHFAWLVMEFPFTNQLRNGLWQEKKSQEVVLSLSTSAWDCSLISRKLKLLKASAEGIHALDKLRCLNVSATNIHSLLFCAVCQRLLALSHMNSFQCFSGWTVIALRLWWTSFNSKALEKLYLRVLAPKGISFAVHFPSSEWRKWKILFTVKFLALRFNLG